MQEPWHKVTASLPQVAQDTDLGSKAFTGFRTAEYLMHPAIKANMHHGATGIFLFTHQLEPRVDAAFLVAGQQPILLSGMNPYKATSEKGEKFCKT